MTPVTRLSAEERRISILRAAVPLFAKNGFRGTTTRQIAEAAEVSEALLYRHFPGKEAIYHELKNFCCTKKEAISKIIEGLTPSTSTLVHTVYFLVSAIFLGEGHGGEDSIDHDDMHRLMAKSYLEDGEFARIFIEENLKIWEPIFCRCVEAAIQSGDMLDNWIHPQNCMWFAHHLAVALGFLNLPKQAVIQYGVPREKLVDEAVLFALRGMGLTDQAIQVHYNPEILALFSKKLNQ